MTDPVDLIARLRSWDHCWPAKWLEPAVQQAADQLEALHQQLADAKASQALVVERAVEAVKETFPGKLYVSNANKAVARIRTLADPSEVEALAALRADAFAAGVAHGQKALEAIKGPLQVIDSPELADLRARLVAAEAKVGALTKAFEPCLNLLDGLVAESGRSIEWGEEDPFRMGEWFGDHDLALIADARAALAEVQVDAHREGGE